MGRPIITLTTDFGTADGYAGSLKGVFLEICPEAQVVDITHEIPPRDIAQGALVVQSIADFFPSNAIHVAVVDPGVGSERQALALETPRARFVGPDNGVLGLVFQQARARFRPEEIKMVTLTEKRFFLAKVSPTFHGRDIFAPVAAHLAQGTPLEALGTPASVMRPAPVCEPDREGEAGLLGQVITVDRFGNCLCDITLDHLASLGAWERLQVSVGDLCLGSIRRTYSDVASGSPLALVSSGGRLELAVRNGNFSFSYGINPGARVRVCKP